MFRRPSALRPAPQLRPLLWLMLGVALPGLPATAQQAPAPPPPALSAPTPSTATPVAVGTQDGGIRVTDAAGLLAALNAATGGETIRLAPGDYGRLTLAGAKGGAEAGGGALRFARPVTVASDDPVRPAVLAGLDVRGVANLVFRDLVFDYVAKAGDKTSATPFSVRDSRDVTIRGSTFDGDVARGGDAAAIGRATGRGFRSAGNVNFDFLDNEMHTFWKGLSIAGGENIRVIGNEFHALRSDGMNVIVPQGILIEANHFHDFVRAPGSGDHADMIQFWTMNAKRPGTDITIRGNLLQAGDGGTTQSIFMRNEMVDKGRAGPEMFYRRVTIEDNVILNGHLHGITLGEAADVVIRRNTLLRDPAFAPGPAVKIPRIRVNKAATGVVVEDNIAFLWPKAQPGWRVEGNLRAQDLSALKPGFYATLFVPRPPGTGAGGGLAARIPLPALIPLPARIPLTVRPDGPAARPGLGAALMR